MKIKHVIRILCVLCLPLSLFSHEDNPRNLNFIQNKGQWENQVLYRADFRGGRLFLEKNAFTYLFYPEKGFSVLHPHEGGKNESDDHSFTFHAVKMEFEGCGNAVMEGADQKEFYHNYFLGNDPKKWAGNVSLYGAVLYKELYPGITVKAHSEMNNVRYDFILAPGADVSQVKMKYSGQERLYVKNGHLYIKTSVGEMLQQTPYAYQEYGNEKVKVECGYSLKGNKVSLVLGSYDKGKELIIDPTLVFSTFTGSTADNWGMSATYDAAGNGYTSGVCFGVGYPTTVGTFQATYAGGVINATYAYGGFDMVVSKFNATGTTLLYSTYLGGADNEAPMSTIVDNANNLILLGRSYSNNYPVTAGAYDVSINGGADIVVTKFNPNGTALLASTFIGGSQDDGVSISAVETFLGSLKYNYADDGRSDVIIDANNNVYVASCTISNNFPVTAGCIQATNGGGQDALVFKLNANLSALQMSTYLGGNANDAGYNIVLDATNNIFVVGGTESANFPSTPGTLKPNYSGSIDGFVTKMTNAGNSILASTFLGTAGYDQAYFIQLDKFGNVYVYGQSNGGYPVVGTVYSNPGSGQFIHEMNPNLNTTIFSTVFGTGKGTADIAPSAFLVDNCENIYISGWGGTLFGYNVFSSTTAGLPVTGNAFQTTTDGADFYFLILQKNASALLYATFMGGGISQEHVDGGTSRFDAQGVVYQAICEGCGGYSDLPTTPGAWSSTNNSFNCNNALVKFRFDLVITLANFSISPSTGVGCLPFTVTFQNSSSNATQYTWNFGDGNTSTQVNPVHTYTAAGSYTVQMVAMDTTTCNIYDTAYAYIRVTAPPVVNVAQPPPICIGSNVQLNATTPGVLSYTWTPGTGLSCTNCANPTATPTVTTQYIVAVADSFCTATDTVDVIVNPKPVPVIQGFTKICSGDSINLSTTLPFTAYNWSTSQSTPSIYVYSSGIYSVTVTDANGCTGMDTIQITVNISPAANYTITSGTGCVPYAANFSSTSTGANSFSWDFGDGNTSTTASPTHTYTNTGTFTVTFIVTDTTNCNQPDTATGTITVNPSPTITIPMPPPYCIGDTVQLNASSPTAITYTWSPAIGLSNPAIPNPIASPSLTTIYTLSVSDGMCTKNDTVTVHVFPANTTVINATSQLCAGDSVVLTATGPGITWQWATGQTTQVIVIYAPGTYVVSTVDANGCQADDNIDINVFQPVTTSANDTTICQGDLAVISVQVNPPGNYTYNWNPPSNLSNPNGWNPIANPPDTVQYIVTVTNGPCVTKDSLTVNVVPLPIVKVTPHMSEVFYGESVTLVAVSNYPVTWVPYDYLSCVTCYTTIATPEKNMTYFATAVNELGCYAMDTARIEIEPAFYVPNAFTPNGDIHNPIFKPLFSGYVEVDVWIFDRWGQEIIHWNKPEEGWDGTFHGKPVQEDVYVYKIIATDFRKKELHKSGIINLIR